MKIEITTLAVYIFLFLAQPFNAFAQHPALDKARETSQSGPVYNFEMTYKDEDIDTHVRVSPTAPIGQRVEVLRPVWSEWSKEFKSTVAEFDADPLDEFWCSDFLTIVGPDASPVREVGTSTLFAFSPQPRPEDDKDDRKFLKEMVAFITVDRETGFVQNFEMRNRKPFKPFFAAKIQSFRMKVNCEASPDGRTYIARMNTDISGRIAFKKFEEQEHRTLFNVSSPQ